MAIPATQMRPGMIIKYKDDLHLVFSVEHRTPGNLRAFIQAKLKNVRTGAMFTERFRSPDPIERIHVDSIKMEYLYNDGDDYYFMDQNTYEQTALKRDTLGDAVDYLTSNLLIEVSFHDNLSPSASKLPPTAVEMTVVQTEQARHQVRDRQLRHQARHDGNRPRCPGPALHQRGGKDFASTLPKASTCLAHKPMSQILEQSIARADRSARAIFVPFMKPGQLRELCVKAVAVLDSGIRRSYKAVHGPRRQ